MVGLCSAKLFVQAYIERYQSGRRLHSHCVHGGWTEFYRKRRGLDGVSFR